MKWCATMALTLISFGCDHGQNAVMRDYIQSMDVSTESFDFATVSGLLDDFNGDACTQLSRLGSIPGNDAFQFFNTLESGNNPQGKVSLLHSPFLQAAVVKNFFIPTPQEALEIAEQEYLDSDQGLGDDIKWAAAQCLYHVGVAPIPDFESTLCSIAGFFGLDQESALAEFNQRIIDGVNEELDSQFPGIFGDTQGVENSLYNRIFNASGQFNNGDQQNIEDINNNIKELLRIPLPYLQLQPSSLSLEFTVSSAKSILNAFYSTTDSEQRACATTLGYHQFSEWIAYMGLERPVFIDEAQGDQMARLDPISNGQMTIETTTEVGRFINTLGNKVHLTQENINSYDPKTQLLLPTNDRGNVLNFNEMISVMQAQLTTFVLTSPAESWASEQYLVGDITNEGDRKVFPAEMHSLSLGLLTLNLKTFGQEYIKKINARGRLLQDDEATAGIVIGAPSSWQKNSIEIRVDDVIALTHFAIDAGIAFENLAKLSTTQLRKNNNIYSDSTITRLLDQDNEDSALYQLNSLHLGAALLLLEFIDEDGLCRQQISWNIIDGDRSKRSECSVETRTSIKSTLERLADRTKSKILMRRSEKL